MRKKLFYLFLLFLAFNITVLGVYNKKNSQNNYPYKEQMIVNDLTSKYDFNNKDLEFIKENNLDVNRISVGEIRKDLACFDLIEGIDFKLLHFYNSNCVMVKLSIPLQKFNSNRYYFYFDLSKGGCDESCHINYMIRYKEQEYYLGYRDYRDYKDIMNSLSYDPIDKMLLNNFKVDNFGTYDETVNVNISLLFKIKNLNSFRYDTYFDFYLTEKKIKKYDSLYLGFVDFNLDCDFHEIKDSRSRNLIYLEGDK